MHRLASNGTFTFTDGTNFEGTIKELQDYGKKLFENSRVAKKPVKKKTEVKLPSNNLSLEGCLVSASNNYQFEKSNYEIDVNNKKITRHFKDNPNVTEKLIIENVNGDIINTKNLNYWETLKHNNLDKNSSLYHALFVIEVNYQIDIGLKKIIIEYYANEFINYDKKTKKSLKKFFGNERGGRITEHHNCDKLVSLDNEKIIVEKPKKQKPKSTLDDEKIVPAGSGSGFFVSKDGHAITNYHVIEGCDINKLSFKGSQTEVKVLAVDKVNDIAILKSNAKPDVIFPVSNEDVSLLEDVIVAGFPLGKQISSAIKTHKGVVTALAGAGDNYSFFQTDAAINQGNSGGPIINQKGNVVGIAVATWVEEGVQGVHFGIKSSTLKTFASANGLSFASPNYRDLSNKDLGKLITKGTVYVECHMTVAKIKKMIAQAENRKAFFKEHK